MTPADRRILEQIDRWLASIDQHLKYVELSESAYRQVQTWPPHERPSRWILEIARQKVLELKSHCESRMAMGDAKFAESLELMSFVATLVGVQHIQRFIPLADPQVSPSMTLPTVIVTRPGKKSDATTQQRQIPGEEPTREMPRVEVPKTNVLPKSAASAPPRTEQRKAPVKADKAEPPKKSVEPPKDMNSLVVADAIRLIKWGKQWHELADLIARIADRPSAAEIRRILRAQKSQILGKTGA